MNPIKSAKEAYKKNKADREAKKAADELAKQQAQVRKPKELQDQYVRLCGIAGDKQYRIECLKAELIQINEQLFKLNQEFPKAEAVHKDQAVVSATPNETKVEVSEDGKDEASH